MLRSRAKREAEVKESEKEQRLLSAYAEILTSPAGKLVLDDILMYTKWGADVFAADPQQNAYNQGRQSIGVHINKRINKLK